MVRAVGGGRKKGKANLPTASKATALKKVDAPDELRDDNALSIWEMQSQVLIERGILSIDHCPLLMAYCNSFSLYLEAEKVIIDDGLTVSSAQGGEKKHPAINARQDALNSMIRIGSLLGLDPMSYSRMSGGGGKSDQEDGNEFSEFA